jgi:hypothetical protein
MVDEIQLDAISFDTSIDDYDKVTPVATFRYRLYMDNRAKKLEDDFLPAIEVTVVYNGSGDLDKSRKKAEEEIIKVGRILARLGNQPGDLHVVTNLHPRKKSE